MPELYHLTHDAGNFDEYDDLALDGGALSISPLAAMGRTSFGLLVDIVDADPKYGEKNLPWTTDILRYGCLIDISNMTMANGDNFFISGGNGKYRFILRYDTGLGFQIYHSVLRDAGGFDESPRGVLSVGVKHSVVCEIVRGLGDAGVSLWVDGIFIGDNTGLDVTGDRNTVMRWGAVSGLDAGTSGELYLDEMKARDDDLLITWDSQNPRNRWIGNRRPPALLGRR